MNDTDILNIDKLSISLNRRSRVSSYSHLSSETLERFSFKINIHSLAELNPRPLPVPNSNLLIFHSRNEIFQKPTSFESPPPPELSGRNLNIRNTADRLARTPIICRLFRLLKRPSVSVPLSPFPRENGDGPIVDARNVLTTVERCRQCQR